MESIQRGGRAVRGFALGASSDDIGSGIAALQAAVTQGGASGINNFGGAVAALLTAGTTAVGTVGPAIDTLSGSSPDVMGTTHLAWVDNDKLSRVNSGPTATQDDVNTAKNLVADMINQYQVAQRLAVSKSAASSGPAPSRSVPTPGGSATATPPTPPAKTPDAPPGDGFLGWLSTNKTAVIAGGAAAVVGIVTLVAVARSSATA